MSNSRNRNYLLYSFLWVQGLLFLYIAYRKRKDRKVIIHFFSLTGFAYLFDFIIVVLLRAYRYYPKFLKKPYFDNVLGSTISQFFIVPAIATFCFLLSDYRRDI
jgi:hypothetical protein